VLHDARMDIRFTDPCVDPRPGAADPPADRRRRAGLGPEPGRPQSFARRRDGGPADAGPAGEGEDQGEDEAPDCPATAGPLAGELAAIDAALTRSTGSSPATRRGRSFLRNPLIYDPDGEESERLETWRHLAEMAQSEPPLLAAALLWDAWEREPRSSARPGSGPLLVAAVLRARQKTQAHLLCVNSALRCIRREKRRSPDHGVRQIAFLEAIAAGAEAGMKNHDAGCSPGGLGEPGQNRRSSSKLLLWWNSC